MKYRAEPYQLAAIRFICERPAAGLFADPGAGKTAVTLAAFSVLRRAGLAKKALVIAPRLVCSNVWPQEIEKWKQFRGLKTRFLHGPKKAELLAEPAADLTLINPEGVQWLIDELAKTRRFPPWDFLIIDESSKFKNGHSKRFKALKRILKTFDRRLLLTGTPAPNGLMDLWAQIYLLDGGRALGRNMFVYRQEFFWNSSPTPMFQRWEPKPNSEERIYRAVGPLVLRIDESIFPDLPQLVFRDVWFDLGDRVQAQYKEMEKTFLLALGDGESMLIDSAAGMYSACRQFSGGRIYAENKQVQKIHKGKQEALKETVDELLGKPALVAYQYRHDLDAIRETLGDIPAIGGGVAAADAARHVEGWNVGQIPLLAVHPDSMAHGLNLQRGGNDVIFYTLPNNLENYQQLIKRLHRRGVVGRVRVHRLLARGTIDHAIAASLSSKGQTQAALLAALRDYRVNMSRG